MLVQSSLNLFISFSRRLISFYYFNYISVSEPLYLSSVNSFYTSIMCFRYAPRKSFSCFSRTRSILLSNIVIWSSMLFTKLIILVSLSIPAYVNIYFSMFFINPNIFETTPGESFTDFWLIFRAEPLFIYFKNI